MIISKWKGNIFSFIIEDIKIFIPENECKLTIYQNQSKICYNFFFFIEMDRHKSQISNEIMISNRKLIFAWFSIYFT